MVEPAACAVHAARQVDAGSVAVIGAGTLGLLTVAAVRRLVDPDRILVATAKHPEQRRWARALGADVVVAPGELARAVRRATNSHMVGSQLTGGVGAVVDCVGSAQSIQQAVSVVAPGGRVHLLGMPARVHVDLTALWHREVDLRGCYAYDRSDFEAAFDLVRHADLGRLVTATYPIERYVDALDHAAHAGARGAVKIAFDLTPSTRSIRKART
jgi:threonine dehydrogenase-like Zn-dependent dehydrogenase